jgi:hypothetical protein
MRFFILSVQIQARQNSASINTSAGNGSDVKESLATTGEGMSSGK